SNTLDCSDFDANSFDLEGALNYVITSTSIFGSGTTPISYSGVQAVTVRGGNAANSFSVLSVANGVNLIMLGSGSLFGSNLITVGNFSDGLSDIKGSLTVFGDNTK